jgi:abortive infection bacteriophage resistance protein
VFREIENSKDKSIISKLNKYLPHTLPNNVVKDIFTFGQLSRHFGNFIPNQTANLIAREFYLEDGDMLKSWLSHFVEIRNCIAHHEIIWNKNFISRPKIPNNKPEYLINQFNKHSNKLYNALTMLNYMGFFRNDNIINMFEFHSPHFLSRMGFPPDWQDKPIWNSQKEKP